MITKEHLFEFLPYQAVKAVHILGADTFAIRRVGYEHPVLRGFCPGRKRAGLQIDHTPHTGALYVAFGNFNGFGRYVGAIYLEIELTLTRIIVIDAVEQFVVEVFPVFKREMPAIYTGVDIRRNQGSLDKECPRTAHRVDQRAVAAPAAAQDYTGGKHLVDGSLGLGNPVAAFMQRLA